MIDGSSVIVYNKEKRRRTMDQIRRDELLNTIRHFSLPRYDEIPNVGLYLEQTTKYISEYMECMGDWVLTGSMISNYVKKGLIANPVKKQYDREQIAYLIFIAVAKSVMSMEDIRLLIQLQKGAYESRKAYEYFRMELENVLHYVFGLKETLDTVGNDRTQTKNILRTVIVAAAHKAYLEQYFTILHEENHE
jgi:hypothetical protein